ncbi:hypothetical protein [Thiosocius teredinicola]|uniref:hypothetical protein n=1 Tax=Thiosocius teredinicola TaxID=1973002 RepID=UPI000F7B00E8
MKYMDVRQPRNAKPRKSTILALVAILSFALLGGCGQSDVPHGRPFDSAVWKSERNSNELQPRRQHMISDLQDNYLRVGMSEDEVLALLGEPDSRTDRRFRYSVGAFPFSADYSWVFVRFDEAGKAVEFGIEQG